LNASDNLIESMKNDAELAKLREKAGILWEDFTYEDSQGNRQLNTDLIANVQKVIFPILADSLKYIPIPSITYTDSTMEFTAKNVVLCGYDIIPENVYLHLESDTTVNIKELTTQRSKTKLILSIKNLRTEIKDVQFHFKRRVFPFLEDSGRVTLRVTGRGANITAWFYIGQGPKDTLPKFENAVVEFDIDKLDAIYDKSTIQHDVLLPMITSLWKLQLIRSIERSVEKILEPVMAKIGSVLSESNPVVSQFASTLERLKSDVKGSAAHQIYSQRQEALKNSW